MLNLIVLQGSVADHKYHSSDRNVGDPNLMGYQQNGQRMGGCAEDQSAGVYCEWIQERYL